MKYCIPNDGTLFEHAILAFPDSSRSTIRSWINHKRITVDGKAIARTDAVVSKGSVLELRPRPLPKEGPVRIRYEDHHLVVIEKPSGVLSVAAEKKDEMSAHDWVKERYPGQKIFVIHRLDKDTSGLMLFALSQEAFHKLKEELKNRQVERLYEAVVEGRIEHDGTWDCYLLEDARLMMRVVPAKTPNAERAITHYKVLSNSPCFTTIECRLETGKKNQIRVQAGHAGHPIVGDAKYGSTFPSPRPCLHAKKLSFTHPATKKRMVFESPVPMFFSTLMQRKKKITV